MKVIVGHIQPRHCHQNSIHILLKPQIDKNNKNVIRDIADSLNYFVIGNGIADNYVVKNVPHGTVKKV